MLSRLLRIVPVAVVAATVACTFGSCAQKHPSYGLIVWSADEAVLPTGSTVAALAHSQLRKTVQVMVIDDKEEVRGDPLSVEAWRVKEFSRFSELRDYVAANRDQLTQFVRSRKLALPVRSDPAIRDGNIVYRMRDQEDAKVISHQAEETDAGGLKGTWYEILTQTGTRGWVFSVQVTPWKLGETASAAAGTDDQLDRLVKGNWRPDDFEPMIASGNYDLGYFRPETGLRFDSEKKTVHLNVGRDMIDRNYTSIEKLSRNVWNITGTELQVTFKDASTIVVQYRKGNTAMTRVFSDLPQDVAALHAAEVGRRAALIKRLAGPSGVMTSDTYGRLSIDAQGNFSWEGADALSPRVIPAAAGAGSLSFDNYLASALRDQYRGVVTFNFAVEGGSEPINFLFQWQGDGIQLEYLPRSLIRDREVKKTDSAPTVLYFRP